MTRHRIPLLAAASLLLVLPALTQDSKPVPPPAPDAPKLTQQTGMLIMRDFTAEPVFARTMFPMGLKGLHIKDGKVSPNEQGVAAMVAENGPAARVGDRVIISNVAIHEKSIAFEINGGPKKRGKWYQHIQVGVSGTMATPGGVNKSLDARGSVVTLEFEKYVPEMTGEQVRAMLAPVFDFKALNQAEAYEKTLPPKVQEAIKNHQVLVGMDREMVTYAKGRPPRKIRDKDDNGVDYEEWIYGNPPEEVDFVRFQGPVVARLEIMTVDGKKIVRTEKEVDLPSAETEVAQKKPAEKPANAPTLRRPGEQVEGPPSRTTTPTTPYPPPVDNGPGNSPDGMPPHPMMPAM